MTNVFIISAPSGSGKSTLVEKLRRQIPNLEFSISYTTRTPRGAEKNGREYFFVSHEQFREMIRKNEFLEYARVFEVEYYGTASWFLRKAEEHGNDLLLDIDVQGAAQVRKQCPDAVAVFMRASDLKTHEERLRKRGTEDEASIERRIKAAAGELAHADEYEHQVINDDLEAAVAWLRAIVSRQFDKGDGNAG